MDEAFGPVEANISIQRVVRIAVMTAAILAAVASAVQEQSAATREMSSSVQQGSAGTSDVAQDIHEITTAAAETGNAAGQFLRDATGLSRPSETINAEVDRFLQAIRKVVRARLKFRMVRWAEKGRRLASAGGLAPVFDDSSRFSAIPHRDPRCPCGDGAPH